LRIAVVSPFLDRSHGTERCVIEQIERYLREPDCQIHIYSQSVQDLDVVRFDSRIASAPDAGKAVWHQIPVLHGPHILNFLWWFVVNQVVRWFHQNFRSIRYDLIFSPGINCWDADAIVVHIVFHEYYRLVRADLLLRNAPLRSWAMLIHRRFYYYLIMLLERSVYPNVRVSLAAVSELTAREITAHFGRQDVTVIPNAVDHTRFNPPVRLWRRESARRELEIPESEIVLLLVGNDWKKKGLGTLLKAAAANRQFPLRVLVVGKDDRAPFLEQIRSLDLNTRVFFPAPSPDILKFYAAADIYVGPSLHDSFALPPIEAMACGLPVITSASNGGSQIITHGVDGFILADSGDSGTLAALIRQLVEQPDFCRRMGEIAAKTASSYTWETNAEQTFAFLTKAFQRKGKKNP
jgi:glycosyltransferase involved in cell wall biosynthesis